jgi:hypothetical protein
MRFLALSLLLVCAPAAYADKASIERYFQALDLNGDGFVSLAEATGDPVVVARFDKGDRNRDGKLSGREFANLRKVKVRVAKAKKGKGDDAAAAAGGTRAVRTTREERRRMRMLKGESGEAGG